jgi:hypothetical protein
LLAALCRPVVFYIPDPTAFAGRVSAALRRTDRLGEAEDFDDAVRHIDPSDMAALMKAAEQHVHVSRRT